MRTMEEKKKLKKLKGLLKILKTTHEGDRQVINDMYEVMMIHASNALRMRTFGSHVNVFKE